MAVALEAGIQKGTANAEKISVPSIDINTLIFYYRTEIR